MINLDRYTDQQLENFTSTINDLHDKIAIIREGESAVEKEAMNNIERAADIISYRQFQETGKVNAPLNPGSVAEHLSMAGLITPDPQIIRTVAELEALDPDTCILDSVGESWLAHEAKCEDGSWNTTYTTDLPAVVIASGEQVRAARTALQEATE